MNEKSALIRRDQRVPLPILLCENTERRWPSRKKARILLVSHSHLEHLDSRTVRNKCLLFNSHNL